MMIAINTLNYNSILEIDVVVDGSSLPMLQFTIRYNGKLKELLLLNKKQVEALSNELQRKLSEM